MLDVSVHALLYLPVLIPHYSDNVNGRVFPKLLDDNASLTTVSCIGSCSALNYTIAGLEFSVQCMVCSACLPQKLAWCLTIF